MNEYDSLLIANARREADLWEERAKEDAARANAAEATSELLEVECAQLRTEIARLRGELDRYRVMVADFTTNA